jgi:carbon monoxide dehydrogenase subunit G
MIVAESSIRIARPADQVFAFADDPANAKAWLENAIEIVPVSAGARGVGTTLRYAYMQGGRRGDMEGAITARTSGTVLEMRFTDRMFVVVVAIRCTPEGGSTTVTHSIGIETKSFLMKLFSPLIRRGNRRQVEKNLSRLRAHLEG